MGDVPRLRGSRILSLLGFVFEGWGDDTSNTGGIALCYGRATPHSSTSYDWRWALSGVPRGLGVSVEPFGSTRPRVGGYDIELSASDRHAQALLYDQRTPPYVLSDTLTTSSTTVSVADAAGTGVTTLAASVIYVGDEAILLGTHAGSGDYTGCTRALWSTSAGAHGEGAGVFTAIPYWEGRVVSLIEHDESTGVEVVRWRGQVTSIVQDGPVIRVGADSMLVNYLNSEINTAATNYARSFTLEPTPARIAITGSVESYRPRVALIDDPGFPVFLQVDDGLVVPSVVGGALGVAREYKTLLGSELEPREETGAPEQAYEVFACERREDAPTLAVVGNGYSPIADMDTTAVKGHPLHPLAIALALLTSTGTASGSSSGENGGYDLLGEDWGLGIPAVGDAALIDLTSWQDEMDKSPLLAIDRLVLGWDGEPVRALDVIISKLLRPFGYFLTIDTQGRLSVARLTMASVEDFCDAETVTPYIDPRPRLDRRLGKSPQVITALIGGLPWEDARKVSVRYPQRSKRQARADATRAQEVDFGVIDPRSLDEENLTIEDLASRLMHVLALGVDNPPLLRIRVPDYRQDASVTDYKIGGWYKLDPSLGGLQNAWLVDNAGARVTDASDVQFLGLLVEREWHPEQASSYTLGLLMVMWRGGDFVRLRAPAARVAASSTTTVINLDDTGPYGDTPGQAFDVGDEIVWADPDGSPWASSAVRTITAVADTSITVGVALGSAPTEGLVVRLADSSEYSNTTVCGDVTRPYVYLADDDTITTPTGSDDADIYGTAIMEHGRGTPPDDPTYQAIDDVAVEASSGDCQPLDAWLEYTLRQNAQVISETGHQVTWTPTIHNGGDYSTHTGHRPYAGLGRSTILTMPWVLQPGLKEITLAAVVRVANEESSVTTAPVSVELYVDDEPGTPTEWDDTQGDTPEYQVRTVAHTFTTPVQERRRVNLRLRFASGTPDTVIATSTNGVVASNAITLAIDSPSGSDLTFYQGETGSRPSSDALDVQYTATDNVLYDHTGLTDLSYEIGVYPAPASNADPVSLYPLSYAQIRSLEVHQTFEDTTYLPDQLLRPGLPVLGEIESTHPLRHATLYRRERPVWIGPVGDVPGSDGGWPDDYTRRFARVAGDASDTDVLEANVWLTTANPVLVMRTAILFTHSTADAGGAVAYEELAEFASTAAWDFWLTADQLEDGDTSWGDATSLGSGSGSKLNLIVPHYPLSYDPQARALITEEIVRSGSWSFREGHLYLEDERLLTYVDVPLSTSHALSTHRPCRVQLHMDFDAVDEWRISVNKTPGDLHATIVGAVLWEIPQ
jgi:hypothetical protein